MRYLKIIIVPFLAGLVLGSFLGRFAAPWHFRQMTPESHEARILKHLSSELNLNSQQKEEIVAILKTGRESTAKLFSEFRPKFEALRTSTEAEIRKILTPEQQAKFNEKKQRRERRRGGRPPFPEMPGHEG